MAVILISKYQKGSIFNIKTLKYYYSHEKSQRFGYYGQWRTQRFTKACEIISWCKKERVGLQISILREVLTPHTARHYSETFYFSTIFRLWFLVNMLSDNK